MVGAVDIIGTDLLLKPCHDIRVRVPEFIIGADGEHRNLRVDCGQELLAGGSIGAMMGDLGD
jgi:hypothetical protein